MEIELRASLEKIQAQASKEPDEDPIAIVTLKASMDADEIGRLARMIGQAVTITFAMGQPTVAVDIQRGGNGDDGRLTLRPERRGHQ